MTRRADVEDNDDIHLQTFRAWLITDRGSSAYVRRVLDGGSQQTFIKEELAKRLKLTIVPKAKISLNTFASSMPKITTTPY